MVSLRGGELKLLALRGRFAVGQRPITEVSLKPDMVVEFARGLALTVESVEIPDVVMALEGDDLPRQALVGLTSLRVEPRVSLVPGYHPEASAWIWWDGDSWRLRRHGVEPLWPGDEFKVGERTFRAVRVAVKDASREATRLQGRLEEPLRIVAQHETVQIQRGSEVHCIGGICGRMMSELAAFAGPVSWEVLAGEVWPELGDRHTLRRKLDVNLARLRKKLTDARIRRDLVHADGRGNLELLLHAGDTVVDRT